MVTEYQRPSVSCPGCGKHTRAPLPQEIAGDFGPELTALVAYLTVVCRLPRRVVWALLEQVLGIKLSLGSVQAGWEEAGEAVAGPCGELEEQLRKEPVLNSDETGYRTNAEKRWLWALVAPAFVFYKVAAGRGAEVLVKLLGEVFAGILCSDRCPTYLKYHKGTLQFCWAHFKRNILGALQIAKTTDAGRFCRDALSLHARLFRLWHCFRASPAKGGTPMTRQQLILESIPIQKRFFPLAQRNLDSGDRDVRNLALALFQHNEKFFAFIGHEGVEPTNNSAERALRCAVQWRKTSFGSRSADGEVLTSGNDKRRTYPPDKPPMRLRPLVRPAFSPPPRPAASKDAILWTTSNKLSAHTAPAFQPPRSSQPNQGAELLRSNGEREPIPCLQGSCADLSFTAWVNNASLERTLPCGRGAANWSVFCGRALRLMPQLDS